MKTMKKQLFNKRHYPSIAKVFKHMRSVYIDDFATDINHFINMFEKDSPKFNKENFKKLIGKKKLEHYY